MVCVVQFMVFVQASVDSEELNSYSFYDISLKLIGETFNL